MQTSSKKYHHSLIAMAIALALTSPHLVSAKPTIDINGSSTWLSNIADQTEMQRLAVFGESEQFETWQLKVGDGSGHLKFGQTSSGKKSLIEVWGEVNKYIPSEKIGLAIAGGVDINGVVLDGWDVSFIQVGTGKTNSLGVFSLTGPLNIENSTSKDDMILVHHEGAFGDIIIKNSQSTSGAIIHANGTEGNPSKFTAGNIIFDNVSSSSAGILVDGYKGISSATFDTLTVSSSNFSDALLECDQLLEAGEINVVGTQDAPTTFKDTLINLYNPASSGSNISSISISNVEGGGTNFGTSGIVYLNSNNNVTLGSVQISNATINNNSSFGVVNAAVLLSNGVDDFHIDNISVENVKHFGAEALQNFHGIGIHSSSSTDNISLLSAKGVSSDSDKTGVRISGVDFESANLKNIDSIVSSDISGVAGTVYGLSSWESTFQSNSALISKIHATKGTVYGAGFVGYDDQDADKIGTQFNNIQITNVTSDTKAAHGIGVKQHTFNANSVVVNEVAGKTFSSGITALNNADVTIDSIQVNMGSGMPTDNEVRTVALYADNSNVHIKGGAINGAIVLDNKASLKLSGSDGTFVSDIYIVNDAKSSVALNKNSTLTGSVDDYWNKTTQREMTLYGTKGIDIWDPVDTSTVDAITVKTNGEATLTLDGGTWNVTKRSFISNLNFAASGGTVDLASKGHKTLAVKNLTGNGNFAMSFGKNAKDDKGQINTDMLYIQNMSKDSKHTILASVDNTVVSIDDLDGLRFATTNPVTSADNFTVAFKDQGILNHEFDVKVEAYDPNDPNNVAFNGDKNSAGTEKLGNEAVDEIFKNGGSNWYLETKKDPSPNPDPQPDPKPEDSVSDAGQALFATGKAAYWTAVEMDRFTNRLGDMRYANGDDGLWIRARHGRIGTDSGESDFRSNSTTYQVGYDHAFKTNNGRQVVGIAFDYTDTELDYKGIKGEGQTDRYALTAYNSYLGENGVYYDAVAKYAKLKNDFDIINGSGGQVSADYDNEVYGISFEAGAKLGDARTGMFIEPNAQLQYTYVNEAHYRTSQNSSIDQGNIESLIARMGYRIGRQFGEDQQHVLYAKADYFHEFMGNQKYTIRDVTTTRNGASFEFENKGDWFDIGAGGQTSFAKNAYAFVDAEMRFGNDFENTWIFNAGMRWQF